MSKKKKPELKSVVRVTNTKSKRAAMRPKKKKVARKPKEKKVQVRVKKEWIPPVKTVESAVVEEEMTTKEKHLKGLSITALKRELKAAAKACDETIFEKDKLALELENTLIAIKEAKTPKGADDTVKAEYNKKRAELRKERDSLTRKIGILGEKAVALERATDEDAFILSLLLQEEVATGRKSERINEKRIDLTDEEIEELIERYYSSAKFRKKEEPKQKEVKKVPEPPIAELPKETAEQVKEEHKAVLIDSAPVEKSEVVLIPKKKSKKGLFAIIALIILLILIIIFAKGCGKEKPVSEVVSSPVEVASVENKTEKEEKPLESEKTIETNTVVDVAKKEEPASVTETAEAKTTSVDDSFTISKTLSYLGYDIKIKALKDSAVISYPSVVTADDIFAFADSLNKTYDANFASYSLDYSKRELTLKYPEASENLINTVITELGNFLIRYIDNILATSDAEEDIVSSTLVTKTTINYSLYNQYPLTISFGDGEAEIIYPKGIIVKNDIDMFASYLVKKYSFLQNIISYDATTDGTLLIGYPKDIEEDDVIFALEEAKSELDEFLSLFATQDEITSVNQFTLFGMDGTWSATNATLNFGSQLEKSDVEAFIAWEALQYEDYIPFVTYRFKDNTLIVNYPKTDSDIVKYIIDSLPAEVERYIGSLTTTSDSSAQPIAEQSQNVIAAVKDSSEEVGTIMLYPAVVQEEPIVESFNKLSAGIRAGWNFLLYNTSEPKNEYLQNGFSFGYVVDYNFNKSFGLRFVNDLSAFDKTLVNSNSNWVNDSIGPKNTRLFLAPTLSWNLGSTFAITTAVGPTLGLFTSKLYLDFGLGAELEAKVKLDTVDFILGGRYSYSLYNNLNKINNSASYKNVMNANVYLGLSIKF